ncbi:MAG: FAD-dependent thymidylate synthase [Desulfovibrio sp.]|jgi:thymidylate synthase (FAD)|nr:FAD-dependent thymidylate synthase [Desulfovibrio sp.]
MPVTQLSVELLAATPNALSLIYAAFRQCYHAGFVADMWPRLLSGEVDRETQADFVRKVMESGHDSPVEHASFTFAIAGISRACSHQIVRHRIASYSQQSQRYVDGSDMDYILPPAIAKIPEAKERFEAFMAEVGNAYRDLKAILEAHGRKEKSKEDARFVLPQAAETRIVITMNCRSLLHFFHLRCCNRAQWEIRAMADRMLALCKEELPAIFATAGAKCESLGYCPEAPRFACGRYPTREQLFSGGTQG